MRTRQVPRAPAPERGRFLGLRARRPSFYLRPRPRPHPLATACSPDIETLWFSFLYYTKSAIVYYKKYWNGCMLCTRPGPLRVNTSFELCLSCLYILSRIIIPKATTQEYHRFQSLLRLRRAYAAGRHEICHPKYLFSENKFWKTFFHRCYAGTPSPALLYRWQNRKKPCISFNILKSNQSVNCVHIAKWQ